MSIEPIWLRKPKHKEPVVATPRGWEVASTGELLVSVRNLDQKIKQIYSTPTALEAAQTTEQSIDTPTYPTTSPSEPPELVQVENVIVVEKDKTVKLEAAITPVEEVIPDVIEDAPAEQIIVEPKAEIVDGEQSQPEVVQKKKRGRPSKADLLARG